MMTRSIPLTWLAVSILAAASPALAQHHRESHGSNHAAEMNALWTAPTLDVARWEQQFESPTRDVIANRNAIVAAAGLKAGDRVADVGAGTGAYLAALSAAVGPQGHVLAVDISPGFVMHMSQRAAREELNNVSAVLGRGDNPTLPAGALDAIITINTFHHFEAPEAMIAHMARALKPGGTLLLVDFDLKPDTSADRRAMTGRDKAAVIKLIEAGGFRFDQDVAINTLKENYALRFQRAGQ
jgi:predicted methyltransferase